MFGVAGTSLLNPKSWEFALGFRYGKSFRHYVGTEEQPDREEEGSQVINRVAIADFGMTYAFDDRNTITIALPYIVAERSQLVADLGVRNETSARGIGDLTVTGRRWMLNPEKCPTANIRLGLGIKLPSGKPNEVDTFQFENEDGEADQEVRTVDQSIQLGDGGLGVLVDLYAFKTFGRFSPYIAGTYLSNPTNTNGVRTWRTRPGEQEMSCADQYVGLLGVQYATPWVDGLAVGLGGRIEGVPVYDLIGGSDGFRRPGYAVFVEPSISYGAPRNTFTLSVPITVQANRQQSVPDKDNDRHGDAAFPDWVLLFGWTHRM